MAPMAMAMPPNDMMFALSPWPNMTAIEARTAIGRMTIATNELRRCIRKSRHTSATTTLSSMSFFLQRAHGAVDEGGAIIRDRVGHALGQALHRLVQSCLYRLDDLTCIDTVADNHDATHGFALAVEFRHAPPHVRAEPHIGHFAEQDGRSAWAAAHGDLAQIVHRGDVALHAEDKFLFRHLHRATTDLSIALLHRHRHVGDGQIVGVHPVRIDRDLVLLHVSTDRGDLGHAIHARELVTEKPVPASSAVGPSRDSSS